MAGRVEDRGALVTGAAGGIGFATARLLASEGARVVMSDIDSEAVAEASERINREFGAPVTAARDHDVTSEESWNDVLRFAEVGWSGLSILINNAGIALTGSVEDLSLSEWRRGAAVNVESVFLGCKLALPLLRERQPASIVNVSSIAGLIASADFANYNTTKAAVWMLTKSVALHCARRGWDIRCNSVHPTFVRTRILDELAKDQDRTLVLGKLARQVPMGRLGEVAEVAQAILYLASNESSFVTASELKIDGGISAI